MYQLNFPNAVTDLKDYFGHREDLNQVLDTLLSGKPVPVIILGERRIGKSSLQAVAIQQLLAAHQSTIRYIPLMIEPRGITSLDELALNILRRLAMHTKRDLRQTDLFIRPGALHINTPAQFEYAFMQLANGNSQERYLICIDEFDEILRQAAPDEVDRINALVHSLIQNQLLPTSLLLTMTRIPEAILSSRSTPFTSMCEVIQLGPMPQVEVNEMVTALTKDLISFTPADLDWIYSISGGNPYFTKLLLSNLINSFPTYIAEKAVPQNGWEAVLKEAVDDTSARLVLENIYRVQFSRTEKQVILFLTQCGGSAPHAPIASMGTVYVTAARNLTRRGYLLDEQDVYSFRLKFVRYWMENWIEYDEEIERYEIHPVS